MKMDSDLNKYTKKERTASARAFDKHIMNLWNNLKLHKNNKTFSHEVEIAKEVFEL